MNYTKKSLSLQYLKNKPVNIPAFSSSFEKKSGDISGSLLGNGEIRCQTSKYAHIYKKYLRKQIAQYALTVGNREDLIIKYDNNRHINKNYENLRKQFDDLRTINVSLCNCGIDPHFMNHDGSVQIKETENSRNLKGLKSCGSNSACPVCASKLSAIRGNQLKEMMEAGRENDRSYMMLVSTIPHQPNEALEITLNQVIDMSRYIFMSKQWREFKKITECRFTHGGLENMISFKNGLVDWHPHKNYLLDFDISIGDIIERLGLENELELRMYVSQLTTSLGQKFLDLKGIDKQLLQPYFQQEEKSKRIHVKAGVSSSLEFDDTYIAKWGLEAEMTAGVYKDGRFGDSFHPFGLLDFIHQDNKEINDKQRYQCIMAFQEFVLASKGKWWFYFARGSVAYYNEQYGTELKVKKDDEELLSLENQGDMVFDLNNSEWLDFEPTSKKIGTALSQPTRKQVIEYIFEEIERNRIRYFENTG